MKFDRRAPGGGIEVRCRLENGRALLKWNLYLKEENVLGGSIHLTLRDKDGGTVLLCMQNTDEEEPMEAILLHPHLWSCESPYLYEVEAVLRDREGGIADRLKCRIPLYELQYSEGKGWQLNGEQISMRAVEYAVPESISPAERQRLVLNDFRLLKELGANCIHTSPSLWPLCEKLGFLIWDKEMTEKGEEVPCLIGEGGSLLASLFYQYKAKWSKEPFVYIVPEKVHLLPSGNLEITVYSNCSRVVLYSGGTLFEFQSGEAEFIFREVPAKGPCIVLSAEGEECSMSLSFHKTFTKSSRNGDISCLE